MKKTFTVLASALFVLTLQAQDTADTDDVTTYWVADLAALPEDKQVIYTNNFAAAKRAYSRSSFSECAESPVRSSAQLPWEVCPRKAYPFWNFPLPYNCCSPE